MSNIVGYLGLGRDPGYIYINDRYIGTTPAPCLANHLSVIIGESRRNSIFSQQINPLYETYAYEFLANEADRGVKYGDGSLVSVLPVDGNIDVEQEIKIDGIAYCSAPDFLVATSISLLALDVKMNPESIDANRDQVDGFQVSEMLRVSSVVHRFAKTCFGRREFSIGDGMFLIPDFLRNQGYFDLKSGMEPDQSTGLFGPGILNALNPYPHQYHYDAKLFPVPVVVDPLLESAQILNRRFNYTDWQDTVVAVHQVKVNEFLSQRTSRFQEGDIIYTSLPYSVGDLLQSLSLGILYSQEASRIDVNIIHRFLSENSDIYTVEDLVSRLYEEFFFFERMVQLEVDHRFHEDVIEALSSYGIFARLRESGKKYDRYRVLNLEVEGNQLCTRRIRRYIRGELRERRRRGLIDIYNMGQHVNELIDRGVESVLGAVLAGY